MNNNKPIRKRKLILTAFALLLSLTTSALGKDCINAVTMVSYEQNWVDVNGSLALKNNTNEDIHNIKFIITYLDMSGNQLDYTEFSKKISIAPGMTKKIEIPAYEYHRNYSYYKSEHYSPPRKFKIGFELKDYNFNKSKARTDINEEINDEETGFSLGFFAAIFALSIFVGIYALVATMATYRNRSAAAWVIISMFFTPILAILILLCIGKNKDDVL